MNTPSRPETRPISSGALLVDILIACLLCEDFSSENSWVQGGKQAATVLRPEKPNQNLLILTSSPIKGENDGKLAFL